MLEKIWVILYGSLRHNRTDQSNPSENRISLTEALPVKDVIGRLDIPLEKVQLAMVNHRAVAKDASVRPGDRVALFPVEYPLFTDWNDFRF